MMGGMMRMRISTTVDATRLRTARQLVRGRDSELFDKALAVLIDHLEAERERSALALHSYDDDPDLELPEAPADAVVDLPYDGRIPPAVVRLARQRRRRLRG
jgi:hypothetical protein